LPDIIPIKDFLDSLKKKAGPVFKTAFGDKSKLSMILHSNEMCKIDFDGKRADTKMKVKVVCVKKLLALGCMYCMWRRNGSSNAFFNMMQVESGIRDFGYALSPLGQKEIKPDDPLLHTCIHRMIEIACRYAPNWSLKMGGEKGCMADPVLAQQFDTRLNQAKILSEFKYTWVNAIFDTKLSLNLDQFKTNIDRRVNSWIFSNARDLRSRLRHHYTDKAKRTEKKYADMPVEDYKTLMKAQFDSCDENKDGRLDFAEFEKFCLAGVKIAGKDEKQLLAFFNAT